MRVGSVGLGVQRVRVVPPHDEPQVLHWGEHRGPRADNDVGLTAHRLEERGVARLRPSIGTEAHDLVSPEQCGARLEHALDVARVRHDDKTPPLRTSSRVGELCDCRRPGVVTEQPGCHVPRRTWPFAVGDVLEERQPAAVEAPGARCFVDRCPGRLGRLALGPLIVARRTRRSVRRRRVRCVSGLPGGVDIHPF